MYEQLSLFIDDEKKPGMWVESHGKELSFQDLEKRVGELIVWDCSTESHLWYQVVRIEEIIQNGPVKRVIFYTGKKQRGLCDETYFLVSGHRRARAYEMI